MELRARDTCHATPRRAGADVTVASVEDRLQVECSRGVKLVADRLLPECTAETYDVIALPVSARTCSGGQGAGGRGRQIWCEASLLTAQGWLVGPALRYVAPFCNPVNHVPIVTPLTPRPQGGMPGAERLRDSAALQEMLAAQQARGSSSGYCLVAAGSALSSW